MKYYRKISNIFWPRKISHRDLYEKTGCHSVIMEIKKHRIRTSQERIPHKAQRWRPPGKRMLGRPKTTWWRAVKTEFREMALTWGEVGKKAKDHIDRRRRLVQTANEGLYEIRHSKVTYTCQCTFKRLHVRNTHHINDTH